MKPMGLDNPRTGRWPWAVVQLRQDNALGTLWNIVGFQTKLKHSEPVRIFRMIPGLEKAEFARLGGLHRNTFIKSPVLLDRTLRLKSRPNIRFAGQGQLIEMVSQTHTEGVKAGETVTITKNTNGPWSGNIGYSTDEAGEYTVSVEIDKNNEIAEANETNNIFSKKIIFKKPDNMLHYAMGRAARSYASVGDFEGVFALQRLVAAQCLDLRNKGDSDATGSAGK